MNSWLIIAVAALIIALPIILFIIGALVAGSRDDDRMEKTMRKRRKNEIKK